MKQLLILLSLVTLLSAAQNSVLLSVSDEDPNGTNVRSTPRGEIAFVIPWDSTGCDYSVVEAVEFREGWWRIVSVDGTPREGWIHNSVVYVGIDDGEFEPLPGGANGEYIQNTPIYSKPTYSSPSGKRFERGGETKIIGCKGPWIKVRHTFTDGTVIVGWWAPEDRCESQLTSCCNSRNGERTGVDEWGNR